MSVVTYIKVDDLYDPILDDSECVFFKSSKIGSFV